MAAPQGAPPFEVDAEAFEEDTYLVLSADPAVRQVNEPLMRMMTRVIETKAEIPGSVVVKGHDPVRLLAIVHDLDQEPSWKEAWIAGALQGIFHEVAKRRLASLGLPFLGTKYGSLAKERFLVLLHRTLVRVSPYSLECLWLITPDQGDRKILDSLVNSVFSEKSFS